MRGGVRCFESSGWPKISPNTYVTASTRQGTKTIRSQDRDKIQRAIGVAGA